MSKRVRFTRNFDYSPKPSVIVAYKGGMVLAVPDAHADAALAAKAAELAPEPTAAVAPAAVKQPAA